MYSKTKERREIKKNLYVLGDIKREYIAENDNVINRELPKLGNVASIMKQMKYKTCSFLV